MNIVIGSDHRGFKQKEFIKADLTMPGRNISWVDVGCSSEETCDYPIFAQKAVEVLQIGQADIGILLCGTGVGMSIAANRFKGVYAGLAWNEEVARLNKEHDNVNVLVLPSDFISMDQAITIVEAWINGTFLEDRYKRRLDLINQFGGV